MTYCPSLLGNWNEAVKVLSTRATSLENTGSHLFINFSDLRHVTHDMENNQKILDQFANNLGVRSDSKISPMPLNCVIGGGSY